MKVYFESSGGSWTFENVYAVSIDPQYSAIKVHCEDGESYGYHLDDLPYNDDLDMDIFIEED